MITFVIHNYTSGSMPVCHVLHKPQNDATFEYYNDYALALIWQLNSKIKGMFYYTLGMPP